MENIILLVNKDRITTGHGETSEIVSLASRIGPNRTKEYFPAFASEELAEAFLKDMGEYPRKLQAIPFYRSNPNQSEPVSIEFSLPSWYSPDEWINMIDRDSFHFELLRTDLEKTEHVFKATTTDAFNFFELGMRVSRILE